MKKSGKRSGFVIYSYFKCSAFTLVEREAKFLISYKKGVSYHLSKEAVAVAQAAQRLSAERMVAGGISGAAPLFRVLR